ncbi:MAG: carbamate kinase [Chloroflexi bacterium]|nr:carbamate kinase [Chloroflexota bacterium]
MQELQTRRGLVHRSSQKTIVVALGGNAILQPHHRGTFEEQYENVRKTCEELVEFVEEGHRIVITHGNGPQVGNIVIMHQCTAGAIPAMPLDVCGAESQGQIGYMIQQNLRNALRKHGINREVVTVTTQVIVDRGDPAFQNPSKPIGLFYSEDYARQAMAETGEKWIEDSGRGWRKVVPSPDPISIVEKETIKALLAASNLVVGAGGGGIPVTVQEDGSLKGVEAVIDKDLAAQRLAADVGAEVLMILTDVRKVALNFQTGQQRDLDVMTLAEAKRYIAEGHFKAGSMAPKVNAAIRFVEGGGEFAVIAAMEEAVEALHGLAGSRLIEGYSST